MFVTSETVQRYGSHVQEVRTDTNILKPDGSVGFTEECIRYLKNHKGLSIRLNIHGYREPCTVLNDFCFLEICPVFSYGADGNCLVSACINIVHAAYLGRTKCRLEANKAAMKAAKTFQNHEGSLYTVAFTTLMFHQMNLNGDLKKFAREHYRFKCSEAFDIGVLSCIESGG